MTGIPKLRPIQREGRDSLINKIIHWIRFKRNCCSLIHSDIVNAKRSHIPGNESDFVHLTLLKQTLVDGLLALEARTLPPESSSIQFRPSLLTQSLNLQSSDCKSSTIDA